MARRALIPDTDTEEVTGLLNEHALGTRARSASRPESKRRGKHAISPKASKTRTLDARDDRRPANNTANKAVKRAPEHGRVLRSATRSVEPPAVQKRKRRADVFDFENVIEEEEGKEGSGLRAAVPAPRTPRKTLARPPKRLRTSAEVQVASGRKQAPQKSRERPEEDPERRNPVAIQDSEVASQNNEDERGDTVEEERTESDASDGIEVDAPLELDQEALRVKMLLGNDNLWNMIYKASGANRNRLPSKERNRLESKIISDLVEKLTEARQVYHSLSEDALAAAEVVDTELELEIGLNEICDAVDNLSKASAGQQASKVVHEAYMNGVTQFISLLNVAMEGRVLKNSAEAYDLDGLEEIIFIQNTFLRFLEELKSWNISSEGFTRNVQQRIKPYLKTMLKNFEKQLARERVREKRRINRDITASQVVADIVSPRVQQQRKAVRVEEIRRRILRSAEEESMRWGGNLRLVEEVRPPVLHRAPSARADERRSDEWSIEEDTALIHELLNNKATRGLPVDERYRMILNNELLSNKLPEHVEERAMWHKPYLVQQMKEDFNGRVPRWVDSIRRTAG